ncbi:MAG: aspartate-alanine antiporter, partial [Burkholderiales bacterium]|nr:aspartate-alanine antiporter [Burkholderiales bacterium]
MQWLAATFTKYPELAVFLVMGAGYLIGGVKLRGFGLGPVTGSLLAGMLLGAVVEIPVSSTAKSLLFLLFLFAIGYSVGPKFFKAMKGDGLRWALLATTMSVTGLIAAYVVSRVLDLDAGFSAGLLSGALTESPAIGTAVEAINALPLPEAERARLVSHVAVADAVCYVFGALGVILFCSVVGPRLLGIDLRAAAEHAEKAIGYERDKPGVISAWRPFELRAYRIRSGGPADGRTVAEVEALIPGKRMFVERVRRDDRILPATLGQRLRAGDTVVLSGPREALAEIVGGSGADEVDDREALDIPMASYGVFVTSRDVVGKTLRQIADSALPVRSVFLRAIVRGGQAVPIAPGVVLERGDVVRLTGPEPAVVRAADAVGETLYPSDQTDFVTLSLGIVTGALIGVLLIVPIGSLRIAMGTSVGTLLAGLVTGYLHSVRPRFGRIPEGAVQFMISIGLAAFVAMIGLAAGPHFVEALRTAGVGLFFGGIAVTSAPLVVGLYVGRYLLKLDPVLLLGGIAGAQTMTAAMAAVQERSGSPIAVLGYSGTVAIGHILLTTWGTV